MIKKILAALLLASLAVACGKDLPVEEGFDIALIGEGNGMLTISPGRQEIVLTGNIELASGTVHACLVEQPGDTLWQCRLANPGMYVIHKNLQANGAELLLGYKAPGATGKINLRVSYYKL